MARKADSPVTYLLRDPKAKVSTPIICVVRFENQRLNVGTGLKVKPSHWSDKGRVKNVVDALDKDEINGYLDRTEKAVAKIITDLKVNLTPLTKEIIRERIDAYLRPAPAPVPSTESTLFGFIADYIERAPKRIKFTLG